MKLSLRIIGILLLISELLPAQIINHDSLSQYYRQYPQEAIAEADRLFGEARQNNNNLQFLQALILKTDFTLKIDNAQYPKMIQTAEKLAQQVKVPAIQCLLYSYIGQLYLQYYQNNRYIFNQRTTLTDIIPTNMESWSANLFRDKIIFYFESSLAPASDLQQLPIGQFRPILIMAKDSLNLRPTLYDFLCHRAINFLNSLNGIMERENIHSVSDNALSLLTEFLLQNFTSDQISSRILNIYQDLLRFRLLAGQPNALLMADLERLEYAYRLVGNQPGNKIRYMGLLQDLVLQNSHTPLVVELWYKEAELLLEDPTNPQLRAQLVHPPYKIAENSKQLALELCENGVRLFPDYNRINLLKQLIKRVKEPAFNLTYPKNIYPEQEKNLSISSKNLSEITLTISRVNQEIAIYEKTYWKNKAPKTKVFHQRYLLPKSLDTQDTTIRIPALKPGLYQIDIYSPEIKKYIPGYFTCNSLFSTMQRYDKQYRYRIFDAMSGKPSAQACIYLYNQNYNKPLTLIDSIFTDRQGYASTETKADRFQVVDARNPQGLICNIFSENRSPSTKESQLYLITDRKVYRPGQTVYFKGISWKASPDTLYPQTSGTNLIKFHNPQGKEIDRVVLKRNDFGSFTGSFKIPSPALNGMYHISSGSHFAFISIADYKRPEFEVTLSTPKPTYHIGDTVVLQGQVKSFTNIPISGNTVSYEISAESSYYWNAVEIATRKGMITTDSQGKFNIRFVAETPVSSQAMGIYYYKVTATATDPKGETQTGILQMTVLSGKYQPVIKIPEQINKDQLTTIGISLSDFPANGESRKIMYRLAKLQTPDTITLRPEIRDTIIEKTLLQGELLSSGEDSIRPMLKNYPSGAYLFSIVCDGIEARKIFYLYSASDKTPPIPTYNWLVKEKTECFPGEKARILFGTSVTKAYVNYSIYTTNGIIENKDIQLTDKVIPLEIPFLQEYGSRIWLNISYVKNGHFIQNYIPISRRRENPSLQISTKIFRDKLTPGQTEEWQYRITDMKNQAVDAEVLAMMYDASLDKIQPYHIPPFQPEYIRINNYYGWNICNSLLYNNTLTVYQWLKDTNRYVIEPFEFDRLKTYLNNEYVPHLFYIRSLKASNDFEYGSIETEDAAIETGGMSNTSKSFLPKVSEKMDLSNTPPVRFRQDFQETAFFYPQLRTDSLGDVWVKFTTPDALTRWRLFVQAHTRKLAAGRMEHYITTSRELMVRPNLPRFLRSGDRTDLKVTVSNLSDSLQQGEAVVELFIPATDSVLLRRQNSFRIGKQGSQTLNFQFDVPENIDLVGCRISASTSRFSDGEQHLLAILPNRILVTQTLPIFTNQSGSHRYSLQNQSNTRQDYRLTFELTANPVWYAVLALPTLTDIETENVTNIAATLYANALSSRIALANPLIGNAIHSWNTSNDKTTLLSKLEQNAELKSILLEASPWQLEAQNETERMQTLSRLFDRNRQQYIQEQGIKKLEKLQNVSGGWSWFKDMPESPFITCNVLKVLAQMNLSGAQEFSEATKAMQIKALRYLDKGIQANFKDKPKTIQHQQLLYLYIRSMYPDIPLGDALDAHKYYLSLAQEQWGQFTLYEKAILAVTLHRYGIPDLPAKILKSLRQYAVVSPEQGMYWPNNRNSFYRNSAVQVHTAIMEAFDEIQNNTAELAQMKQWLLLQKQTQAWASVPATVDAVYALLKTGSEALSPQSFPDITLGKQPVQPPSSGNPLGYIKKSFTGQEIHPDMLTVKITKQNDTPSWGGLYLQYFEKLDRIKPSQTGLQIDKQLFIEETTANAKKYLTPIHKHSLKIGDKIIVRLTFSLDRDMEFLHLKDLRAACFEPEQQLSGIRWKFNTVYYEDTKDAATNFFFYALSRGTYVIEYAVRINQSGEYQDGIATFQSAYAPEFNAYSKAVRIKVE